MSDYKCGLVSISFRGHTPEQILSAMKEAGLSYIEWGSDVHAPKDDIKKLNDPDYVARYAREKYLYSKNGELIIRIPDDE